MDMANSLIAYKLLVYLGCVATSWPLAFLLSLVHIEAIIIKTEPHILVSIIILLPTLPVLLSMRTLDGALAQLLEVLIVFMPIILALALYKYLLLVVDLQMALSERCRVLVQP